MEDKSSKTNQSIITEKMEQYLRQYPGISSIEYFQEMFKLTYTYSSPFTDSRNTKEVLLPKQDISKGKLISNKNKKIAHNS